MPSRRPSTLASAGGSTLCSLTIQMFDADRSAMIGRLPVITVGRSTFRRKDWSIADSFHSALARSSA